MSKKKPVDYRNTVNHRNSYLGEVCVPNLLERFREKKKKKIRGSENIVEIDKFFLHIEKKI